MRNTCVDNNTVTFINLIVNLISLINWNNIVINVIINKIKVDSNKEKIVFTIDTIDNNIDKIHD